MKDIVLRVMTISIIMLWFGFIAYVLSQETNKEEIEKIELQIKKEQLKQLRLENFNKMIELEGDKND